MRICISACKGVRYDWLARLTRMPCVTRMLARLALSHIVLTRHFCFSDLKELIKYNKAALRLFMCQARSNVSYLAEPNRIFYSVDCIQLAVQSLSAGRPKRAKKNECNLHVLQPLRCSFGVTKFRLESDQNQISPHTINTKSGEEVIRINKIITTRISLSHNRLSFCPRRINIQSDT